MTTPKDSLTESARADSQQQMAMPHGLIQTGGKWLGAAREWLQWNTRNGDSVTWGSNDVLQPNLTVKMVEELAAHVAAAAINEERARVRHSDQAHRPATESHELIHRQSR